MSTAGAIFADPVSQLALEVFRCNGELIAAGDALVAPLGLTSARWQVLGAIAEANGQLSVPSIARNMGLVRQSVQRVVNDLVALGFVQLAPNPHHQRAKLVHLTPEGEFRFDRASTWWLEHTKALASDLPATQIMELVSMLGTVRKRLGELETPDMTQSSAKNGGRNDPASTTR